MNKLVFPLEYQMVTKTYLPSYLCDCSDINDSTDSSDRSDNIDSSDSSDSSDISDSSDSSDSRDQNTSFTGKNTFVTNKQKKSTKNPFLTEFFLHQ